MATSLYNMYLACKDHSLFILSYLFYFNIKNIRIELGSQNQAIIWMKISQTRITHEKWGTRFLFVSWDVELVFPKQKILWSRDGTTLGLGGAMALPKLFLFLILLYICMLILAILFYKITFCFPLTISLILLGVILYSQIFFNKLFW